MRRLIDTLIFALVAYSICWPVARSLSGPIASPPPSVRVTIEGCAVVPSATVHVARSAADADASRFVGRGLQQAGVAGATVDLAQPVRDGWAVVEFPGSARTARSLELRADERPVSIEIPADVPIVTGTTTGSHRLLRVTLQGGSSSTAIDVPCDATGRFVFALPPSPPDGETSDLLFESAHGERLAERDAPRGAGVHEVGEIGG